MRYKNKTIRLKDRSTGKMIEGKCVEYFTSIDWNVKNRFWGIEKENGDIEFYNDKNDSYEFMEIVEK